MDLEALRRQLNFEMTQLPQYKHLAQSDIENWIDTVLREQPERAMFHMQRLFSIGGSEIGALVQSRRNLEAEFVGDVKFAHLTDQDIFDFKYLKVIPKPSEHNGHLLRGTLFEPQLRKIKEMQLVAKYGSAHTRPDLVHKVLQYKSQPQTQAFNWARVQIDDIWQVGDNELILTDYKFPTPDSLTSLVYQEPCMYSSQVTLGKMIAHELGIPITKTEVAPLNIVTCEFEDIDVPFDAEFEEEIMTVGSEAFQMLCSGRRPVYAMPKYQIVSSDDLPISVKKDIVKAATYRNTISALTTEISELDSRVAAFTDGLQAQYQHDFKIEVAQSNLVGKWKNTFLKDKAIELLRSVGVDENTILTIKSSNEKLKKAMKSAKIPNDVVKEACYQQEFVVSATQTRASQGEQAELAAAVKGDVSVRMTVLDELIEDLIELTDLTNSAENITQRQQNQLKTLRTILKNAPNETVRSKVSSVLDVREKAYTEPSSAPQKVAQKAPVTPQTKPDLPSVEEQLSSLMSAYTHR